MIFHSIRWRLQIWYGIILVAVLAGFGITAYQLERARRLRGVEDELQRSLSALMSALELNAPGQDRPEGEFDRPPPDARFDPAAPQEGPLPRRPPPNDFKLPPQAASLFTGNDPKACYFIIWRRDGTLMAQSTNQPANRWRSNISLARSGGVNSLPADINFPSNQAAGEAGPRKPRFPPRPTDDFREVTQTTPPGETLLVGRSIASDLAELHQFAWTLGGIGAVVLLCGLAGGWWLAARAIAPIEDISAAAVKIAAGDLSRRIDVADTENELGRLAAVLNSTFARLEAAFSQQGRFTADAAHELRTPVTVILTQTQSALKHPRDAADYRETVEACQRSAQKMRRLLESLLELARLDAGQEPMQQQRLDLAGIVGECVEHLQPLASERQIKIQNDLSALECTGDAVRLAQVFTNLLTNAIHYNKAGGEVRVSTQGRNGSALVTVADTGVGISAEDLPHVFERFYRADQSRSSAAGRNGLGLSISKAIIEAHGGNIEVSSQPGVGTTFNVRLPRQGESQFLAGSDKE